MPDPSQLDLISPDEEKILSSNLRRLFVNWDRPLLDHAVDFLASSWNAGVLDLSDLLVIVPTRHSGRRLREALAIHTAERGAVFPPTVVTPDFLVSPDRLASLDNEVATSAESLIAWIDTLRSIDIRKFRNVFPVDPVERSFSWALHTAAHLADLRKTLAETGLTIEDAAKRLAQDEIEPHRWRQLAALENRAIEKLAASQLLDPVSTRIRAAREGTLPDHLQKIVLLGVADPLPLALEALQHHASQIPVEILVYAPTALADSFDEWGRPLTPTWQSHPIDLDTTSLHRATTPAAQAAKTLDLLSVYDPAETARTAAVCVADANVAPPLRKSLASAGLKAFEPAGHSLETHETFFFLNTFTQLLADRSFAAFAAFIRCPDFNAAALSLVNEKESQFSHAQLLRFFDQFHADHLPHTIDDAAKLLPSSAAGPRNLLKEVLAQLRNFNDPANSLSDLLPRFLNFIYSQRRFRHDHPADNVFFDFATAVNTALDALESPAFSRLDDENLTNLDRLELLLHLLKADSLYREREPRDVDLQGWLELFWENAPHLVITGFNDGNIPAETVVGDPYLPNTARELLGLRDNNHWLARDTYYLTSILAPRHSTGRVDIVLGRVADDNTPLRPSRLLFRCPDHELPVRAIHLFHDDPDSGLDPETNTTFSLPWRLQPPALETPGALTQSIRVTAFKKFLACPFRFYLSAGLGMDQVELGKIEMNAMDFGNLCHHVLQSFGRNETLRNSTDPAEIGNFFSETAHLYVTRKYGDNLSLPLLIQRDAAVQRLAHAAEIQAALRAEGWMIQHAEYALHEPEPWTIDRMPVRGTIDRIDRHEKTGALRVIDYKTSNKPFKAEDAHLSPFKRTENPRDWQPYTHSVNSAGKPSAWIDLQLPLYVLAARDRFNSKDVECAYFNLPRTAAETGLYEWKSLEEETLASAMRCAEGVINAIRNAKFWPPSESVPYDDFEHLFFGNPGEAVDETHFHQILAGIRKMIAPADVKIQNEMILASAGSGKTYQLTNRYIGLMALGVDPEKIIALTFTRKAAGEFFDSILKKLADAANDEQYAAALAADSPYIPSLTSHDYRRLLRLFIDRSHLLFLGTLDSFFVSIIHNFPFEFGLSGEFEILDDHLAALEKDRVYRDVFTRPRAASRKSGKAAASAFLEAFKQATFGREENSLLRELNRFVDDHHEIFLSAPHEDQWGNPKTIWPEGSPWLGDEIDLHEEFDRLFAIFEKENLTEGQIHRWESFRHATESHTPGNPLEKPLTYLLDKILAAWDALENGDAVFPVERRKQTIPATAAEPLRRIVKKIVGAELASRLLRTRGIWTVLHQYENAYAQLVRRRGKLTFNDLQLILSGADSGSPVLLSQQPSSEAKLNIDYRLDGRYDHWLLDEFQDTNQLQWRVVENLIDEVMQDPEGRRTLFQVGDIKQAIYAWRGGDTRLFYEIRNRYNTENAERIVERELNESWRSGPDVIRLVNRVFGSEETLRELFPAPAVDRWDWRDHAAAKKDLAGFAALINPVPAEGEKLDSDHPLEVTAAILNDIQPVKNNLSCAVLFQTNKNINRAVELLRQHCPDIPFLNESETTVATNSALNLTLLALLKIAAHPGDTFAWQHLQITPFAQLISKKNDLVTQLTRQIFDDGFEATLQHWIDKLRHETEPVSPQAGGSRAKRANESSIMLVDTFNLRRAEELLLAAQQFDQTGNRDISSFLTFAERYTLREPATRGVVNLMTIHKAKGLGFDVVILPDLGGNSLATTRDRIGVKKDPDSREIDWIYDLPQKAIAENDPVLASYLQDEAAEACFENLCKFYVAVTRAKRALYCIANPPPQSSKSHNFIKLLHETLPENDADQKPTSFGDVACDLAFATGHQDWHQSLKKESSKSAKSVGKKPGPEITATTHYRRRPIRRTPSAAESHEITSKQLFSRGSQRARDHGTAVHALFEQIEWLDDISDPATLYPDWESAAAAHIPPHLRDDVRNEALSCLSDPSIRNALSKPEEISSSPSSASSVVKSSQPELWRERRFEILLNDDWFTGTFDRVVVDHANNRAAILDFKTDTISPNDPAKLDAAVDGYRPQLETYRRVLSRMTGLPASVISLHLLFTKLKKIVDLA